MTVLELAPGGGDKQLSPQSLGLTDRRGVQIVTGGDALRRYDPQQRRLTLGAGAQAFHLAPGTSDTVSSVPRWKAC